jgi:ribosomal protein L29
MKKKFADLMKQDADSLMAENRTLLKRGMGLRFQHGGRNLKETHELRALRRNRARVQTALRLKREEK